MSDVKPSAVTTGHIRLVAFGQLLEMHLLIVLSGSSQESTLQIRWDCWKARSGVQTNFNLI